MRFLSNPLINKDDRLCHNRCNVLANRKCHVRPITAVWYRRGPPCSLKRNAKKKNLYLYVTWKREHRKRIFISMSREAHFTGEWAELTKVDDPTIDQAKLASASHRKERPIEQCYISMCVCVLTAKMHSTERRTFFVRSDFQRAPRGIFTCRSWTGKDGTTFSPCTSWVAIKTKNIAAISLRKPTL